MRHSVLLIPWFTWLCACPSTSPRPDGAEDARSQGPSATLPSPLINARDLTEGRLVATGSGWRFERGSARSGELAWPPWMSDAACVKDVKGLERHLAWPIEGTGRLLVLGQEALLAEPRPDCLAAVPLRRSWAVLGDKTVELSGSSPRVVLFGASAPDPALGGLALLATESDLPSLELAGKTIEPFGAEPSEEDQLLCLSEAEIAERRADDPDFEIAPSRHKVSATWRGGERVEVLELTVEQSCESDPSQQGGAVSYERAMRWVLERHGAGWRQVELEVSSSQSSSGDGAGMSLSRREGVNTWVAGAMALVGRWSETSSSDSSHFSSSSGGRTTSDWWLVPVGLLAEGFDVLAFDDAGLRLTPPSEEPERMAEQTFESGTVPVGRCELALEVERASLRCGDDEVSLMLEDDSGTITRRARVWDLGPAFYVLIELDREHRWTEEAEGDDSWPIDRASQESSAVSVIVSKRGAAMLEVGTSRADFSM